MKLFSVMVVLLLMVFSIVVNSFADVADEDFYPIDPGADQLQLYKSLSDSAKWYPVIIGATEIHNSNKKNEFLYCNIITKTRFIDPVFFNNRKRSLNFGLAKNFAEWLVIDISQYYYDNLLDHVGIDTVVFNSFYERLRKTWQATLTYRDLKNGVVIYLSATSLMPVNSSLPSKKTNNQYLIFFIIIVLVTFFSFLFYRGYKEI